MAQNISVNVYEINSYPAKNIYKIGFPVAQCQFLPYNGNNTALHANIQTIGNQFQYSVVETVAQLVTLANA